MPVKATVRCRPLGSRLPGCLFSEEASWILCLLKVKKKIIINALCQLAVGCQFAEFPNPDQVSSVHPALGVGAWSLSVIAARWG